MNVLIVLLHRWAGIFVREYPCGELSLFQFLPNMKLMFNCRVWILCFLPVHRRSFCVVWMSTLYVCFYWNKALLDFHKVFVNSMFPGLCVICMFIFLCFSFLFFIFVCWENSITHIVITNGEMHFQFNSNSFIDHFTWQCVMKRSNF